MRKLLNIIKYIGITAFSAFTTVVMLRIVIVAGCAAAYILGISLFDDHPYSPYFWEEGEVGYIDDNNEYIKLSEDYIIRDCLDNSKPDTVERMDLSNISEENDLPDGEILFSGMIEECYINSGTVVIKSGSYRAFDTGSELLEFTEFSDESELVGKYDITGFKRIGFWE